MSHELSPLFDLENTPASPISPSLASSPPSLPSSKLKRLSLVAKPRTSSLDIEREIPVSAAYVRSLTPTTIPSTPTNNPRRIRHSVIGNPAGITYSPSPAGTAGRPSASSMGLKNGESVHSSRGAYIQSPYGSSINVRHEGVEADRQRVSESEESQTLDPQTFMNRHADLLRLIAQKERRVHELRDELQQQESSLESLKAQWSSLVSLAAPSSAARPRPATPISPSRLRHPRTRGSLASTSTSFSTSESVTPSSSSLATIGGSSTNLHRHSSSSSRMLTQPNPSDNVNGGGGLEKALSGIITHTEEYLGPEVVQGGIKFLGNLWKTVGAAAGGTVPVPPIAEGEGDTRGREEKCLMNEAEEQDETKDHCKSDGSKF
ncbi:hypothetical protein CNBJ0050 [Cryptococcus deneoformans B-3501A]|uniref:Expressed protein n=1 Tax=Cryptococcus deneoformans (strain JEC21 / ATCC MYA-565) TaxID=214684 RepID=Q5KA17_CRYD1|nr:expressed protein [Cryptococcus neoformans var. neoformans JEC21]XP_773226.1 hypothetical protein CNBJ0050 [Cryptococcus neoformans var. neoformans B-3501A]AAW45901.1 expressed protein [Cryptococcus neoformans var. neoformans JEC21]EAL18579.1 hypothetical protein CNBJ0050 [Cryptococcus neoformans var. neoformans B-3501A]